MITKSDFIILQKWAKTTRFPLRREGITSKYMKYDPSVCYVKFGKNKKIYRDKLITDEVKNIINDQKRFNCRHGHTTGYGRRFHHQDIWGECPKIILKTYWS